MIKAEFLIDSYGKPFGFEISSHAGKDVIYAAVTSAVNLAINIISQLETKPDITVTQDETNPEASKVSAFAKEKSTKTVIATLYEQVRIIKQNANDEIQITEIKR